MSIVERLIPGIVFEWSLQFKTMVIVIGALILLFASFIRPEFSIIIWGPIFLFGGLIEWMIVATVYLEMELLEEEVEETSEEIRQTGEDVMKTQQRVETAIMKIEGVAKETYDRKERMGMFDDLESVGHPHPGDFEDQSYDGPLEERLRQVERRLDDVEGEVQ